jgi:hypothetical protein
MLINIFSLRTARYNYGSQGWWLLELAINEEAQPSFLSNWILGFSSHSITSQQMNSQFCNLQQRTMVADS